MMNDHDDDAAHTTASDRQTNLYSYSYSIFYKYQEPW
jgi:hypothetical protein